jgi:alginate O-acetyltransferase complex protein AlgI
MFFASFEFIGIFLPIVFIGFFLLQRTRQTTLASYWLIACSCYFYWSLDEQHLLQLVESAGVNFLISRGIGAAKLVNRATALRLMWGGVVFNIAFLCWFKYGTFLTVGSAPLSIPLGVSFFTIQQIAYLVSTFNSDEPSPSFGKYLLFISFFPYVIAGPVVMREEIFSQFDDMSVPRMRKMFLPALTLFSFGLFKKVMFADNIGGYVDQVFAASGHGIALTTVDAWCAAALYTLQLYFDFSGYSDMAVGIAGLFGINLPRNFHSPLKAGSVMEFWRRWHMSATRFFTNYLYLPLVLKIMRLVVRFRLTGVAQFLVTVLFPMLLTFLLIGLWHGAGMTAVVFGLFMGLAIAVNHTWRKLSLPTPPALLSWMLTMGVVVIGMVFSRADDMNMANGLLRAMLGLNSEATSILDLSAAMPWLISLTAICVALPNTHEIMGAFPLVISESWADLPKWQRRFVWSNGIVGSAVSSTVLFGSIVLIPKAAQFIYYRF